jgi:nitrite reductase/ring-hydroxylating ferredoxin subunit
MAEFVKAALVSDVPPGVPVAVVVNGRHLALYQLDGVHYATAELCTHAEASLCDGDIEGCSIVCPLHFGSFDIKTGQALDPPACDDLETYPTKIVGDEIHVEV